MEGIISGILVSLLIGLGIGFAVGRKAASAQSGVGSKLAIQQALDSQKAQLAHALANHRQQLAQLEQERRTAEERANLLKSQVQNLNSKVESAEKENSEQSNAAAH